MIVYSHWLLLQLIVLFVGEGNCVLLLLLLIDESDIDDDDGIVTVLNDDDNDYCGNPDDLDEGQWHCCTLMKLCGWPSIVVWRWHCGVGIDIDVCGCVLKPMTMVTDNIVPTPFIRPNETGIIGSSNCVVCGVAKASQ